MQIPIKISLKYLNMNLHKCHKEDIRVLQSSNIDLVVDGGLRLAS